MSKLETNTIDNISGSSTLTIGDSNASTISIPKNITLGASGTTITVPSGATITNNGTQTGFGGTNTPAFNAYRSSSGSNWSPDTFTKVTFNAETLDTNNNYNVSNGRFTPTVAGNYFCYYFLRISWDGSGTIEDIRAKFNFNGSDIAASSNAILLEYNSRGIALVLSLNQSTIINFNGSSDYLEVYARNDASGGGFAASGSFFGAYKIIE